MSEHIVVSGGAGVVGSAVARELISRGFATVVIDEMNSETSDAGEKWRTVRDLTSHAEARKAGFSFYRLDVCESAPLAEIFRKKHVDMI